MLAKALALKRQALSVINGEKRRLEEIAVALPAREARRRLNEHLLPE